MPVANFVESVTVYDDVENASNPQRKHVDWKRSATGLVFEQVGSERFLLTPGATRSVVPSVGLNDLSATPVTFAVASGRSTWYQVRGAFASSPWALPLAVGATAITLTANTVDYSAFITGAGLAALTAVQPGDWVYLAGSGYGDAGNWSAANQGFWVVTAVSGGLYVRRAYADDVSPVTETITTAGVNDVQHLPDALRPRWVAIYGSPTFSGVHSCPAAAIGWVGIPTDTGFVGMGPVTLNTLTTAVSYVAYVRVESDQPIKLSVGDVKAAPNDISLLPVASGSPAWYEAFAFTSSLGLLNNGDVTATINLIYAFAKSEG